MDAVDPVPAEADERRVERPVRALLREPGAEDDVAGVLDEPRDLRPVEGERRRRLRREAVVDARFEDVPAERALREDDEADALVARPPEQHRDVEERRVDVAAERGRDGAGGERGGARHAR